MKKKWILAMSWHPGGINAIIPVVKKLEADGHNVLVLGHEFSEPILAKVGLRFKTIKDFGLPDVSLNSMRQLLRRNLSIVPDLVLTGTAQQEGKANDVLEHTITLAARDAGIKTLAVLDFWDMHDYWKRFTDERTGEKFDLLPDHVAILDEIARLDMVAEGFPPEKLVITGNPHFDDLPAKAAAFTQAQRDEVRLKVGLSGDTLFFFGGNAFKDANSNAGQYWDLDVVTIIAEALKDLPGVGCVTRLHPRMSDDQKAEIKAFIETSGVNMKLVDDVDSQTLALAADLTIVEFSTLGLEAVYMRKPCISLQPGLKGQDQLIVSSKGIIQAGYDAETCKKLLVQVADPAYRERLLEQAAGFTTDGKATDRVVELIYSLLKP